MKKNSIISKSLIILPIVILSSCTNETLESVQQQDNADALMAKNARVSNNESANELIKKGWKVVKVIQLDQKSHTTKHSNESKEISLTDAHLKDLGYDIKSNGDKHNLKKAFSYKDEIADGIWFNSNLSVDANKDNYAGTKPDAKIKLGKPQISNKQDGDMPDEVFETEAVNQSNSETELTVKYGYKQGYKTSWQRKVSGTLKVGAKVGIDFAIAKAEISTEVTVGGEKAHGEDTSNEKSIESSYKVKVPARSKVRVKVFTHMKYTSAEYTVPYSLSGTVRTNFKKKVDGHYFWANDIINYPSFKPNIKNESGATKVVNYIEVKVLNSPAEKL